MYNLIVTDLDGTLLNNNHKPSQKTIEILRKLKEKNIDIIIATGRAYCDALRIKEIIGIDMPMITLNGAVITDIYGNVVKDYRLNNDYIEKIYNINYTKYSDDIVLNSVIDDKWYVSNKIDDKNFINDWCDSEYCFEYESVENLKKLQISKIYYTSKSHEKLVELEKEIYSILGDSVNYAFTMPFCLEIFPKEATKENALKELSKIYSYDLEKSLGFGDGFNDKEFLIAVKKGFIMKNASNDLKEKLNNLEIIGYNYEDGVANKLKEIFNIN